MRAGDVDTRARDWSADLAPVGDTITAVLGVPITRRDGTTISGSDLTWVPPAAIDVTGQITTISLRGGVAGVTYVVPIEVQTAQGRTLYRDAYLTVAAALG